MTWLRLAFANLGLSPLTSAVNVVLMGLGTASIVLLLLAGAQLSETLSRDARGVDLVLGAKGSPVQLVLAAVYHADVPPGNIQQQEAERWASDPRVATAIPLSLGDSYRGFRIVGTTKAYADLYQAGLTAGEFWSGPMEAVAGSAAAQSAGIEVGSRFAGAHGLVDGGHSHESRPYRVVGVLEPTGTVADRLILTSLESVWALHDEDQHRHEDERGHEGEHDDGHEHDDEGEHEDGHGHGDDGEHGHEDGHGHGDESEHEHEDGRGHEGEHERGHEDEQEHGHEGDHEPHDQLAQGHSDADREITAMLIRYQSPLAATTLPREVNAGSALQAASPAMEISRILQLVGIGLDGLTAFSWVLILTAALSVFAALYGSLRARRGDLAMLRCLGATRWELLWALLLEGLLLSVFGVALGFLAGHLAMELLGGWLESARGVALTGWTWIPAETVLLFGLFGVGALAAALPAVQAYHTDVARTLAEG
ncbi:MAG: ABC transporter permease [Gammaproteobacteria bacterium]|nr:ABC transporter permease [Gammaproteobacteria bacterium]